MTKNQSLLKTRFPDLAWFFDFPLGERSYFKVGGPAEIFYEADDLTIFKDILTFCDTESISWTIIGGVSNVIIADAGIQGLVLRLNCKKTLVLEDNDEELLIESEMGIKTSVLVMETAKLRATGLEGFVGVPGNLGGAIFNNAHYSNHLIGDHIESVTAFHVKQKQELVFSREQCNFAYEKSVFQTDKNLVILKAIFKLAKAKPELIKNELQSAQEKRLNSQPLNFPSSGCVFKNPVNTEALKKTFPQFADQQFIPAGFLIDQAGLKGKQIGQIAVSQKHAAFLVNLSCAKEADLAKASDIKALINLVKATVKSKFNLELQEEIFYLGQDKEN